MEEVLVINYDILLEEVVKDYEFCLKSWYFENDFFFFDMFFLGMGFDGYICFFFFGYVLLKEMLWFVVLIFDLFKLFFCWIMLIYLIINVVKCVVFVSIGVSKVSVF